MILTGEALKQEAALKLKIKDDTYEKHDRGTFSIFLSETPKKIMFLQSDGRFVHGIYTLDGDALTICQSLPGGAAPTEFKGERGSVLYVYQREKR